MTEIKINEIDVQRLNVGLDEVLVIKPSFKITPEEARYIGDGFRDLGIKRVVVAPDLSLTVVSQDDV